MKKIMPADVADNESSFSSADWTQLCEVMNGYIYSQALSTACDFDLFTHLSQKPGASLESLCSAFGLSHYAARVLLLGCCAAGLICRDDAGRYFNSPMAEKALVADSPLCMIPFIQFNHRIQRRCSVHFTKALKEDRNAGLDEFPGSGETLYERLIGYPELECLFQRAMGAYTRLSPKMMDLEAFSHVRHLLDVGGGDATNAIRLCRRYPELRVTILEIPSVAQIARVAIQRAGLADRISCTERDMFKDAWPQGCDGVLFSHLLEIFSPEVIAGLYRRAWDALASGGRLFVWTIMANDDETQGLQAAKSSIYFLCTASGQGMAYPGKDHEEWIRNAGFSDVRRYSAPDIDHGALVAIKQSGFSKDLP